MNIINELNRRYATKKFDSAKKLTQEQLDTVLESVRLSPSAFGLQPYQVLVIQDPEIREKLKQVSHGQTQITDASELIVFCRIDHLNEQHVSSFIQQVAETRGITVEHLVGYQNAINSFLSRLDAKGKATWAAKQCYIALGVLLTSCATLNIDACPMEGFQAEKYDEILSLKEKGLASVVVASIGFRSQDDDYQHYKKVRKSAQDLFVKI